MDYPDHKPYLIHPHSLAIFVATLLAVSGPLLALRGTLPLNIHPLTSSHA